MGNNVPDQAVCVRYDDDDVFVPPDALFLRSPTIGVIPGNENVQNGAIGNRNAISHNDESHYDDHHQISLENGFTSPKRPSPSNSNSSSSWSPTFDEAAAAPILQIRCKDSYAELYKGRFGSGSKGKCVLFQNSWVTPSEFESISGRASSKDWKRTIRFDGRTLQNLIENGHLAPHAASCLCYICEDNPNGSNFMKPFVPSRRRRKIQTISGAGVQQERNKLMRSSLTTDSSDDSIHAPSSLARTFNPIAEALTRIKQISLPPDSQEAWKVVEEAVDDIVAAAISVKTLIRKLKENATREMDNLRSQQQQLRPSTFVPNHVTDYPHALRLFTNTNPSNENQTQYSTQVMDTNSFKSTQCYSHQVEPINFQCENCGRDGSLQCSGCHIVHYCSSDCQEKDWSHHQTTCLSQLQRQTMS